MKNIKYIYIIALLCILAIGCNKKNWDNYDGPNAGIYGKVTDAKTGQSIENREPGGGIIRMIEQSNVYKAPGYTEIELTAKNEYKNTLIFAATYKVFPLNGPFKYYGVTGKKDSALVVLTDGSLIEQNFQVFPYFRVDASVTDSIFSYTISAGDSTKTADKISDIIFMVSKYPTVDESVCGNLSTGTNVYKNRWLVDMNSTADATILNVPRNFTLPWVLTRLAKGDYYFRVGVRASTSPLGRYNYSPVIKATVH